MPTTAEAFLIDQLPKEEWGSFARATRNAYKAAADLRKETPFLNTPVAINQHGRLVSWALDSAVEKLVASGTISTAQDLEYAYHATPTGKYLRVRLSHSLLTISLLADPGKTPRRVRFRENLRLSNAPYMFSEMNDEAEVISGLPHILMVHGHQSPDFLHFGIPSQRDGSAYEFRTQNIMNLPFDLTADDPRPPMENTDDALDEIELLKEEIRRWEHDHGG